MAFGAKKERKKTQMAITNLVQTGSHLVNGNVNSVVHSTFFVKWPKNCVAAQLAKALAGCLVYGCVCSLSVFHSVASILGFPIECAIKCAFAQQLFPLPCASYFIIFLLHSCISVPNEFACLRHLAKGGSQSFSLSLSIHLYLSFPFGFVVCSCLAVGSVCRWSDS